jgi:hypothetical protein
LIRQSTRTLLGAICCPAATADQKALLAEKWIHSPITKKAYSRRQGGFFLVGCFPDFFDQLKEPDYVTQLSINHRLITGNVAKMFAAVPRVHKNNICASGAGDRLRIDLASRVNARRTQRP